MLASTAVKMRCNNIALGLSVVGDRCACVARNNLQMLTFSCRSMLASTAVTNAIQKFSERFSVYVLKNGAHVATLYIY